MKKVIHPSIHTYTAHAYIHLSIYPSIHSFIRPISHTHYSIISQQNIFKCYIYRRKTTRSSILVRIQKPSPFSIQAFMFHKTNNFRNPVIYKKTKATENYKLFFLISISFFFPFSIHFCILLTMRDLTFCKQDCVTDFPRKK